MTDKAEGKSSGPGWLLGVSGIANLLLAIVAGWASYEKSQAETAKADAEAQKTRMEQELQVQASMPSVVAFHLIADLRLLRSFLDSKEALPFTDGITRFTFHENEGLARMQAELAAPRTGRSSPGTMTFLVLVNGGTVAAENLTLRRNGQASLSLGALDAKSAILLPVGFQPASGQAVAYMPGPEVLEYVARIGAFQRQRSVGIARQESPRWTLSLGGAVRGFGRANPAEDEARGVAPLPD